MILVKSLELVKMRETGSGGIVNRYFNSVVKVNRGSHVGIEFNWDRTFGGRTRLVDWTFDVVLDFAFEERIGHDHHGNSDSDENKCLGLRIYFLC